MPKYVASRTLDAIEWRNMTLLAGDVTETAKDLKNERGDVFPWFSGDGKRLLGDGTNPAALELTNVETSSTGVQILR